MQEQYGKPKHSELLPAASEMTEAAVAASGESKDGGTFLGVKAAQGVQERTGSAHAFEQPSQRLFMQVGVVNARPSDALLLRALCDATQVEKLKDESACLRALQTALTLLQDPVYADDEVGWCGVVGDPGGPCMVHGSLELGSSDGHSDGMDPCCRAHWV